MTSPRRSPKSSRAPNRPSIFRCMRRFSRPKFAAKNSRVIAELAGMYAFCYDEKLRAISAEEITGENFAGGFRSVVLADSKL